MQTTTTTTTTTIKKRKPHILLGLSGSVATIKAQEIYASLCSFAEVRVVATDKACHFLEVTDTMKILNPLTDAQEWKVWEQRGDPVIHIDLRKWADILLIAPLSANTLAKLANGLCDNLLTCVARAWDFNHPFVVCPAMNTMMWLHPITNEQLSKLEGWGVKVIPPVTKTLICGDSGHGALAHTATIVDVVKGIVNSLILDPIEGND